VIGHLRHTFNFRNRLEVEIGTISFDATAESYMIGT